MEGGGGRGSEVVLKEGLDIKMINQSRDWVLCLASGGTRTRRTMDNLSSQVLLGAFLSIRVNFYSLIRS